MRPIKLLKLAILVSFALYLTFEIYNNWIIIYPLNVFGYHKKYDRYDIYSDQPLSNETDTLFDQVTTRLEDTPGFLKNDYKVFLCNKIETYKLFSDKVGRPFLTQGMNIQPINYIFVNLTFIRRLKRESKVDFKYSILEGNPAHIIAHEICHQLIADQIGYLTMLSTDRWKKEGYCEYMASIKIKAKDPKYDFFKMADTYFHGGFNMISKQRKFYIKSLLATEYYFNYKNHHNKNFFETELSAQSLLKEIISSPESKYHTH